MQSPNPPNNVSKRDIKAIKVVQEPVLDDPKVKKKMGKMVDKMQDFV